MVNSVPILDPDKLEKAKIIPATDLPAKIVGNIGSEIVEPSRKMGSRLKTVLIVAAILAGLALIIAGISIILSSASPG
jgi:hypothetical protein